MGKLHTETSKGDLGRELAFRPIFKAFSDVRIRTYPFTCERELFDDLSQIRLKNTIGQLARLLAIGLAEQVQPAVKKIDLLTNVHTT